MNRANRVIWGILLVAAGVLFGLNVLGITDVDVFFDGWWTLFLIIPCGVGMFTGTNKMGNAFGFFLGVFLLLNARDILAFSLVCKLIFPVLIVLWGLKLMFGGFRRPKVRIVPADVPEGNETCAVFSSCAVDYSGKEFTGAELTAVFGGLKCDLRNAVMTGDCTVKVSAIFGGITLLVPKGVNIQNDTHSLFGGVSCGKMRQEPGAVTLCITGGSMFGGVDVK